MKVLRNLLAAGLLMSSLSMNAQNAKVQIIHNCADLIADSVDIYAGAFGSGTIIADNFAFRNASQILSVPSGIPITIYIAPKNSTSSADAIYTQTETLVANENYVIMAQGLVTPASYASNPNGVSTGFGLKIISGAKFGSTPGNVDFTVVHGSTDAPAVDVFANGSIQLVDSAVFKANTNYTTVPAANYWLGVRAANAATNLLAYDAPLSAFAGKGLTIFASGFLTPSANQNGAPFGIFAADSAGNVVQLSNSVAQTYIIHNSADPAADSVDVYLNGEKVFDDFGFRRSSGWVNLPAYVPISIGVAPKTSTSASDILASFPFTLEATNNYVVVANGVLNPANFAANPGGSSTGFNLFAYAPARTSSQNASQTDVLAFHGVTDAPAVDIRVGAANLFGNLAYGEFQGYQSSGSDLVLNVAPAGAPTVLASYNAPLSALTGQAITVFASGFLTPSANQNGRPFGLFAALQNGDVVELSVATSIDKSLSPVGTKLNQIFPNPATNQTAVSYTLGANETAEISIIDVMGRTVFSHTQKQSAGTFQLDIPVTEFSKGLYSVRLKTDSYEGVSKLLIP